MKLQHSAFTGSVAYTLKLYLGIFRVQPPIGKPQIILVGTNLLSSNAGEE
jgi:hypothetical protein